MVKESFNYQKLTEELDEIVVTLEKGDSTIEKALELHARAEYIIAQLEEYLSSAENKVSKVVAKEQ